MYTLARFPTLFNYLRTFIRDKWSNKDQIEAYLRVNEANKNKYRLTLIHAEDDWDVPSDHTSALFRYAVNGTRSEGIAATELDNTTSKSGSDLGAAGTVVEWRTEVGVIREEILKFGLHDVIMGNSVITSAVMRIFEDGSNN
jgi:abhydrolase domain-containing protein 12